jgi:hypothetical protein
MLTERDHKFATDVLNASLNLMSILIAVIALLFVAYKDAHYPPTVATIRCAIQGVTGASCFSGVIAFLALIHLRSGRGRTSLLVWAFGALIVIITIGIVYVMVALLRS